MKIVTRAVQCECMLIGRHWQSSCRREAELSIADLEVCRHHSELILRGLAKALGYKLVKEDARGT